MVFSENCLRGKGHGPLKQVCSPLRTVFLFLLLMWRVSDFHMPLSRPENFLENQENSRGKSPSHREEISFEQVLEFISADTGVNRQKLVSEINSMQDRLSYLVDIRIVALIVAKKFGCDIEALFEKVSRAVLGPYYYT